MTVLAIQYKIHAYILWLLLLPCTIIDLEYNHICAYYIGRPSSIVLDKCDCPWSFGNPAAVGRKDEITCFPQLHVGWCYNEKNQSITQQTAVTKPYKDECP